MGIEERSNGGIDQATAGLVTILLLVGLGVLVISFILWEFL